MKKLILLPITISAFILGCTNSGNRSEKSKDTVSEHDSILKVITGIEAKINSTMSSGALDPNLAGSAANAYELFVRKFPKDTSAPVYLFKVADIYASALHQYDAAVSRLEKMIQDYPDHKKIPLCYFELGVIYDDNINDDAKAKTYYETFLKKFPDHKLAPQVKALISYLGKTNEDLLKEFEKKNKK